MKNPDSNPLVLMVDDGPENLQLLGHLLRREGYALAAASSGAEALEYLEQRVPDLVLLDVMMPKMDGFEVCRRMREMSGLGQVPVLFLSARADQESINKGLETGGDDYVTKPFNARELLARVRHHIERARAVQALAAKDQEHRELLHVLSHDLANPLGTIASFAELVEQDPSLAGDLVPKITRLALNGLDLIELIRRMRFLDEKGIEVGPLDLCQLLREVAEQYRDRAGQKGLELELDTAQGECWVLAERSSLMHSVLANLLTNAIKFSLAGGSIRMELLQGPEGPEVVVRDQGVGMPPPLLGDLFDLTKRTSRQGTEGEQGTGFGMPLVLKFMTTYGGSVQVQSKDRNAHPEDHGTQVRLRFRAAGPE